MEKNRIPSIFSILGLWQRDSTRMRLRGKLLKSSEPFSARLQRSPAGPEPLSGGITRRDLDQAPCRAAADAIVDTCATLDGILAA